MLTLATILCLLLTAAQTLAVQPYTPVHPDPGLESWRWRSYPELKGRGLACMTEDRDGNLWFGVDDGVVRYDGSNWVAYTPDDGLVGGQVREICITRKGEVYVGTREGLSRFRDGRWERVFPKIGDMNLVIQQIIEAADGSIWATTRWGALRVREGRVLIHTNEGVAAWVGVHWPSVDVSVVPDEAVLHLPWPNDNHWGAFAFRRVVNALADGGPADAAGIKLGDRIVAIEGDSSGDLGQLNRIGTPVQLSVERMGASDPFEVTVVPAEVVGGTLSRFVGGGVYEDSEGNLWFANAGAVVRYSNTSTWQLYKAEDWDGRGGGRVLRTRDGMIWVASGGTRPLRRFDGESWKSIRLSQFGGSDINTALFESQDGTLWVGAHGGLYAYRDGNWQHYRHPEIPLPRTRVRDILQAQDGALWIASSGQEASRLDISDERWMTLEGLSFGAETRDRSVWFISPDSGVVRHDGKRWVRFGVEDGLMDLPRVLLATRNGGLWAGGSHDSTAATARFEGSKWVVLETHPKLSWNVGRATYEAMDGSVWFGAGNSPSPERGESGGLMQYDGVTWHHHAGGWQSGSPPWLVYGIGQISESALWAGSFRLVRYDGQAWTRVDDPPEIANTYVDAIYSGREAGLWLGTRAYGVFHYDGQSWARYGHGEGLADTRVVSLTSLSDGSVLAATDKGISRFDGSTWTSQAMPTVTSIRVELKTSSDGSLWINTRPSSSSSATRRTIRYRPETVVPETRLTLSAEVVSQPGNTTFAWEGADPWEATPNEEIQYAHRLDGGDWSAFSHRTSHILQALSSGDHSFEVKARDRDFNEDATPATASFTVVAPVWQQGWFIGMVIVFVGGIGFQTSRVIRRDRRLREGNEALSAANNELFQVNRDLESVNVDLQREQVLERLRGQALGMQSSDEIGGMVESVFKELRALGLPLISSGIAIANDETREVQVWVTSSDGKAVDPLTWQLLPNSPAVHAFERGETHYHVEYDREQFKEMMEMQAERGNPVDFWDLPEDRWPDRIHSYGIFFDRGHVHCVQLSSAEVISEDNINLIRRFGEAFGFAHARWEELKVKEAQNSRLAVEASVQHLRAEVQSMDEASDFERILSLLTESLKTVDLTFDGCGIDVLDEPVENPTMEHFEKAGFRYTAYRIDPQGTVSANSFHIPSPFPDVYEQTIDRFIEGEPWEGMSQDQRIVEVPAGSYGRLRLTATDREQFTDDEIATLREFADAVALGYARYLDIREIQLNTERKSEFLASMSHELRTPMNAIKGFTDFVLRRDKSMEERSRENLQKVTQASDRLLAMIDDLLDLSKIEAGSMDVNPERFAVHELVTSACDTVSPLIQEGVELRQDVAGDIGVANTDKARLQQMVINLLSNAIKFTESGSVTVRAERGRRERGRKPGYLSQRYRKGYPRR